MAKLGDHLSFRDAVRAQDGEGEDEEAVLTDEEQQEPLLQERYLPPNPTSSLPIYKTIHMIRREVIALIDDPYTPEQLKAPKMNKLVIRPLVDQLYDPDNISVVYCLLVNRVQFLREQAYQTHSQTVNITRALLCEVVASRVLRRFDEDHGGRGGLLLLANILVTGFEPFQGAPPEIRQEIKVATHWAVQRIGGYERKLTALEVALISRSKSFLSSTASQRVVDAIYQGQITYTPTTFLDIIPDRYKNQPVSLYDPSKAPLLNHYRLIVPRIRNVLDIFEFMLLLFLYILVMSNRHGVKFTIYELVFCIYALGWCLEEVASMLEHGWKVYTQNLWSFLDFIFCIFYAVYLFLRLRGLATGDRGTSGNALVILATAAPILIPRLAFNFMSENILFVSFRAMMADFAVLSLLAVWCFAGFFLAMKWLCGYEHTSITISKWMLWVWFGLDATGIQRSVEFHWLLGPILMVTFAFLGNTLFLTILVAMLTNTFSIIVADATAERQFQRAVMTFEGVKSDAIFAYQTPFNILALFLLLPLKLALTPRWFHKIHVTAVRSINAPILLFISLYERKSLWAATRSKSRNRGWFYEWKLSRFSVHGDLESVFDTEPPRSVLDEIADSGENLDGENDAPSGRNRHYRSESISRGPYRRARALSTSSTNELTEQLSDLLRDHNDHNVKPRLQAMEEAINRIEKLLGKTSGTRGREPKAGHCDR